MRENLRDGRALIIDMRRREPKSANACRRKPGPPDRLLQQLRRFDPRKNHALRSAIERACDQRILHIRHTHQRRDPERRAFMAQRLERLDSESAMLGVEKSPMKSRRSQDPRHFKRSDLIKSAADLQLALFQRGLNRIQMHLCVLCQELSAFARTQCRPLRWSAHDDPRNPSAPHRIADRSNQAHARPKTAGSNKSAPADAAAETAGPKDT